MPRSAQTPRCWKSPNAERAFPPPSPRSQFLLDFVEPVPMGLDDAPGEAVVEEQVVRAAGDRPGDGLGGVESGADVGDLVAERPEALEHHLFADDVGGGQTDDRLVLYAGKAGRLFHPLGERGAAPVGEHVMRARPRLSGLLARAQV